MLHCFRLHNHSFKNSYKRFVNNNNCSLSWKKTFCAFPFHEYVPGSNLERNAKNARNVTRLRDLCSAFQNGF